MDHTIENNYNELDASEDGCPPPDKLLEEYLLLVKKIANIHSSRTSDPLEAEERIDAGIVGLAEAYKTYDPLNEAAFTTWAYWKIKSAVLDYDQKADPMSPRLRKKESEIYYASKTLAQDLRREPTDREIADELNITVEEINRIRKEGYNSYILHLYDTVFEDNDNTLTLLDCVENPNSDSPYEKIISTEIRDIIEEAIDKLPHNEKFVIRSYYFSDNRKKTLKEIGKALGVSESRISQIHSQAVQRLKTKFREKGYEIDQET